MSKQPWLPASLLVCVVVAVLSCRPAAPAPPRPEPRDAMAGLRSLLRDSIPIDPPPGCFHMERPWTEYWCPDIVRMRSFIPLDSVRSTWLIIHTIDGRVYSRPVPNTVDAIFLSRRSIDSIFVRYYRTIGQNAKADSLAAAARRLSP